MRFQEILHAAADAFETEAVKRDAFQAEKVASDRKELSEKLKPAVARYERLTGKKMSMEQVEALAEEGPDSAALQMLLQLAEAEAENPEDLPVEEMGGPADDDDDEREEKGASYAADTRGSGFRTPLARYAPRGRRRSHYELKLDQSMSENQTNLRYQE